MTRTRLADVIQYNGEVHLLPVRLAEHWDFVDRFFIVESTRTFSYQPKALYFDEHRQMFDRWKEKITYVVLDADKEFRRDDAFHNERLQRSHVKDHFNLQDYDYVLQMDVDEIIDRRSFPDIIELMQTSKPEAIAPRLRLFCYFINAQLEREWDCTRIFRLQDGQPTLNVNQTSGGALTNALVGFHFSFIGSPADVRRKVQSYSHVEYAVPEFTDESKIADRMRRLVDPFDRDVNGNFHILEPGEWLPQYIRDHWDQYKEYLYSPHLIGASEQAAEPADTRLLQMTTRFRQMEENLQRVSEWASDCSKAVEVRDREVRRLQQVLEEAVEKRDQEIHRLQRALNDAVEVRDQEIFRLQAIVAEFDSRRGLSSQESS